MNFTLRDPRTNWKYILIVAVLGLFAGGIMLVLQVAQPQIQEPAPMETQPQEKMQTEVDTSTWQTYRNEGFGFELRYPASLYPSGGPNQVFLVKKAASTAEKLGFSDNIAEIGINKATHRFYAYFNSPDNSVVENYGDLKLRSFEIGGYSAVEYGYDEEAKKKEIKEQDDAVRQGSSVGMIVFPKGLMANKNGTIIEIFTYSYHGDFKEVFDQILSTFRFIEE